MSRGLRAFNKFIFVGFTVLVLAEKVSAHSQIPFGFFRAAPATTCAGTKIGGYCWYAGSGGTAANCQAILDAVLGAGALGPPTATTGYDVGCSMPSAFMRALFTSPATTCSGAVSTYVRVCTCNL